MQGLKSPHQGISGSHPGQCVPSNLPNLIYVWASLSQCLDSLSSYHLNSHYNSSLYHRNLWADAFLHRLNGIDYVMGWQECVEGGTG